MADKNSKENKQPQAFDFLAQVVTDSMEKGFFDDVAHINMQRLIENCKKRGLVGVWTQESLSKALQPFEQASREMDENQIEALLTAFATVIAFDVNLVKRHFFAIKQGWETNFLKQESGIDLFPKDTETLPSAVEPIGKDEQ